MDLEHGSGSRKNSRTQTQPEVADGSGSSKHSRKHAEDADGSGSSKHSGRHPEVADGSGSSKHSRTQPEVSDGSGSSKHSGTYSEVVDGSVSSEHSDTHPEVNDGSGSSKHSKTRPEIIDRTESGNHFEIHPEVFHGNRSSNQLEILPEIIDRSGSSKHSEKYPEVIDRSDSNEHSTMLPDATDGEANILLPVKKLEASSSSSSSSSASSLDDLFQVDTNEILKYSASMTSSLKPDEDTQSALKDDEHDVSSDNSSKAEEHDNGSLGPASTSQVSDVTHESTLHSMSPTQSPPTQVMDRSGGYDPYRIPSSVFERNKSITPMDWSVASNESLFSIHVENNSFSRDHIFMMGGDMVKSGELTKSGELIMLGPPPPVAVVGTDQREEKTPPSVAVEKPVSTAEANETIMDATKATAKDQREEKTPPPAVSWNASSVNSSRSDGSETSTRSFAFPILTDGVRNASVKEDVKEKRPQTPSSRLLSFSASYNWLPRFFSCSWCSFRCCCCC